MNEFNEQKLEQPNNVGQPNDQGKWLAATNAEPENVAERPIHLTALLGGAEMSLY